MDVAEKKFFCIVTRRPTLRALCL